MSDSLVVGGVYVNTDARVHTHTHTHIHTPIHKHTPTHQHTHTHTNTHAYLHKSPTHTRTHNRINTCSRKYVCIRSLHTLLHAPFHRQCACNKACVSYKFMRMHAHMYTYAGTFMHTYTNAYIDI